MSLYLPHAMKFLLTVSPTKFFSLTCPLYVRTHCPDSTFHSFSSLSVELQGETRVVSLISRHSPSFLYCQYCSTYTEEIFLSVFKNSCVWYLRWDNLILANELDVRDSFAVSLQQVQRLLCVAQVHVMDGMVCRESKLVSSSSSIALLD